jgi:hypothetical protein
LRSDPHFLSLAYMLAWSTIVLIRIDVDTPQRRIVTFSYVERVGPAKLQFRRMVDRHGTIRATVLAVWTWYRRQVRAVLRGLGWRAKRLWFAAPALDVPTSYHFELQAPKGLQVVEAQLRYAPAGVHDDPYGPQGMLTGKPRTGNLERGSFTRSHLYMRWVPPGHSGLAIVKLRPRVSYLVRPTWLTALFAAVVLGVGWSRYDEFAASRNGSAAAALLLVVPSVLSLYLARPDEADLTTRLVFGLRLLAAGAGMLSFCAAGTIVAGRGWDDARDVWFGIWVVALVLVAVLSLTLVLSRTRKTEPDQVPDPGGQS